MEKTVYLILSREKDTFDVVYVGDCEKTDENRFFVQNSRFKCWMDKSRSEKLLYLAILPMLDSDLGQRKRVISKIVARYRPECNMQDVPAEKPAFTVRTKHVSPTGNKDYSETKTSCPCCGSEMTVERILEKSRIVKCPECGLSDTRLNS